MHNILISYRRDDSLAFTGRVFDRLTSHFGQNSVLMDIDSIPFGTDFRKYLTDAIDNCRLVLVVIGERWIGLSPDTGKRRIDEPGDFVRMEVETALKRGLIVIPVLVGNTQMPAERDLPESIKSLAYRNALRLDPGRDFHHHVDRLIEALDGHLKSLSPLAEHVPESTPGERVEAMSYNEVQPGTISTTRAVVELVSGPDKGQIFPLRKDRTLLGRAESCDIPFNTQFLSRFHAQFVKTENGFEFEDLNSSNGSFVNGVRISGRVELKEGDHIQIGQVVLIYYIQD